MIDLIVSIPIVRSLIAVVSALLVSFVIKFIIKEIRNRKPVAMESIT